MTEYILLYFLLGVAILLAPLMTNGFFLRNSKLYGGAHKAAIAVLIVGVIFKLSYLSVIWPVFCVLGFLLFLSQEMKRILTFRGVATCIPFVFSIISAVWLFAGSNDLRLLGYDPSWSYYAALHGSFLGWLFVGCLAFVSQRERLNRLYIAGCYLSLVCFLLVAFGIDGVPYIKRIGVIGFAVIVPFFIALFRANLREETSRSRLLGNLSLLSVCLTMALALMNEFWIGAPRVAFGFPIMVFAHGFLNAMVTIPCFYFAILSDRLR
ncbi:MAG: hypothetical protein EOP05_07190 [Proteobacteria bacterium]|nr:MAG: hypothetical protein EOP05_07190 [Pseudomonadota bacterium]